MNARYVFGVAERGDEDLVARSPHCEVCGELDPFTIEERGSKFHALRTDVGLEICGRVVEVEP